MKRLFFLLVMVCLWTFPVLAQTFKGTVADDSGTPVPYAALYLRELRSGVTTDENGCFRMKLPAGDYTCEVSSLGFASQTFSFRMDAGDCERNVVLAERVYTLPEVRVRQGGEDPAYGVMRQAIARAPYHRTQVKGFTVGAYQKGSGKINGIPAVLKLSKEVRKESKKLLGKLFVFEERQRATFTAPNRWNRRILASRNSFPEEMQMSLGLTTVNLYTPELYDKISPLSPKAFSFYRFRLDGCYAEEGRIINKIHVMPKRKDERLMEGDIFIVEDLWCISALDFSLDETGVKGHQKVICKEVHPEVFLPTSSTLSVSINVMGLKGEASYLAAMHYAEVITDSHLLPAADTLHSRMPQARPPKKRKYERQPLRMLADTKTDSLAFLRDSAYWDTVRSVPLRPEEWQSFQQKEELLKQALSTRRNDTLRTDSAKKRGWMDEVLATISFGNTLTTPQKRVWLKIPSVWSVLREYNFVDGFWVGLKLRSGVRLSQAVTLRFTPEVYYTTARKSWVGQGDLSLDYAPLRNGHLSLSGGLLSADYNGESGESRFINATASSLLGHNHLKLYEKAFLTLQHSIEPFNGVELSASLSWQRRSMLQNHVERSWFKRTAEPNLPVNKEFHPMPANKVLKADIGLEVTPAHYYHLSSTGRKVYEDSRYPTFGLRYERAFPLSGSEYRTSYHRLEFSMRQEVGFGVFNRFCWSACMGTFWQASGMQFPDFKHFPTTDIWVTERSFDAGFSLLDNYLLATDDRWAQANLSWYTPCLLLKWLPFLSGKPFDEALHLRSVIVDDHRRPYSEAGYSFGVSDLGRVGVFVGFDRLKYRSVGVSVSLPLSLLMDE